MTTMWLEIRPLGLFFAIILAYWLLKLRCSHSFPSIKIVPPPELGAKLFNVHNRISSLRKETPGVFCFIVSSILAILAVIGQLMSGSSVVVFGLIAAGLISTKYNFKILKIESKDSSIWPVTPDYEVDEFLPEVNDSNLFVLDRASDQTNINCSLHDDEDKTEEVPEDLLIPDLIPEIDEHSDESSDDELILKSISQQKQKTMDFKNCYFKKDGSISPSSSDENSISKGLNFQNYSLTDSNEATTSHTVKTSDILPNLVAGLVSWNINNQFINLRNPPQLIDSRTKDIIESSDESDFEILNSDDLT